MSVNNTKRRRREKVDLSIEDIISIRKKFEAGQSIPNLATEYNVSYGVLYSRLYPERTGHAIKVKTKKKGIFDYDSFFKSGVMHLG